MGSGRDIPIRTKNGEVIRMHLKLSQQAMDDDGGNAYYIGAARTPGAVDDAAALVRHLLGGAGGRSVHAKDRAGPGTGRVERAAATRHHHLYVVVAAKV